MKKPDIQWFIKPLGSYISVNEEVARVLNGLGFSIECEVFSLFDNKGEKHLFMWKVAHHIVQAVQDNKLTFGFRFRIFNREGQNGILREWKFPARKKSAKFKKAEADLKEIQKKKKQKGAV